MKGTAQLLLLLLMACQVRSQSKENSNLFPELERIETTLSSNDMRGRRAGTPDIDRAADFIAAEFRKAGLQPLAGNDFLQKFSMMRTRMKNLKVSFEDQDVDAKKVVVITTDPEMKVTEKSGYSMQYIKAGDNLGVRARAVVAEGKDAIVWVDTSFARNFPRLISLKQNLFPMKHHVVFVLGSTPPQHFTIKAEHEFDQSAYANVVGMIPGKSKKNEYVIFSGHYDHLGIARDVQEGDSIYNGANDDAAGTTAVILLADYFKKLGNNERTLIFAAFTAEEIGGYGSQYFSKQFDPAQVMAMFNIEMIGTESKWGRNSAYITGFEKTDMGSILQKNLQGTGFSFYPDPYTTQNLFYRSDNATLARLGVPAHTISTSKMDSEPNYHKVSDEVGTLDLGNMAAIVKAIALSAQSIISGKDTPSRVKPESLN